ncbi:MAG: ATP-binding protein [Ancalomicrobiaceae bacterium]|nr:ATP-binding protein [Ancalomicrobiaceae bacterium]
MARPAAAPGSVTIRSRLFGFLRAEPRIIGPVRLLAAPAYRRLLAMEPYVRRSIPVLIIGFITILAISRTVSLFEQRMAIEDTARSEIALEARAVAAELTAAEARLPSETPGDLLRMTVEGMSTARVLPEGRLILLTDQDGTVVATAPQTPQWEKRPLTALLGQGQALTTLGERIGTEELTLTTGVAAMAAAANVTARRGAIAVVQSQDAILGAWRSDLRNSAMMFVFTASILLVLTYAYFAQVSRAAEADTLYADTIARSETAFKRGRCGLWEWDLSRGRIYWARAIFEMLGLEPDDGILGFKELRELVHPDDVDLIGLANLLVSGQVGTFDQVFRMRHIDGHWLWFRVRAEVVERLDTGSRHLIGTAADITEHKLLADKTATADLRLRDAIETISEAFVLWDAENRLVLCNSKYQQLHHLSDDDISPMTPYSDIMQAARQPTIRTPVRLEDMLDDRPQEAGSCTYEAQIDDGRWLQINERRTKDGGFVSVGTDITQLKRHEEKLLDSEKRLMGMVADLKKSRLELVTHRHQLVDMAEKLSEEKQKAEEANKIKSEFLANISHELRTPLNAIIGFSEIICAGMFGPDKYREYGSDILESGRFLLNVINDILDMSKIEAGRLELSLSEIEIGSILAESARVLAFQAEEKGLTLTLDSAPDIQARADRRAVKQIVLNLLSNAVKFTPRGGTVKVSAHVIGDHVTVAISDSGIGIPAAQLPNLGRPFVQVANQFTKTHRGSGLGLAIARSLIELHGGEMQIGSKEGVGTTVSFDLPRLAAISTAVSA